jgi:hypothetical protein
MTAGYRYTRPSFMGQTAKILNSRNLVSALLNCAVRTPICVRKFCFLVTIRAGITNIRGRPILRSEISTAMGSSTPGTFLKCLNDIRNKKRYEFINIKHNNKKSGTIDIGVYQEKEYILVEYLKGGLNISGVTCIDFTGSNGDPNTPGS